jgi:hypothetical protein
MQEARQRRDAENCRSLVGQKTASVGMTLERGTADPSSA